MQKMKFIAVLDGQEHQIIVKDQEPGLYKVEVDGREYIVDSQTMPSQIVSFLIDHKSYDLDLDDQDQSNDPLDGRIAVRVRGRVLRFEMLLKRRKKMKDAAFIHLAQNAISNINSPMPGKILRYLVKDGDEVKKGQGLVVIEAMKMENELKAHKDGIVKKIASSPGTAVDSQTLLLIIE
jgi:biotin carboxyl carrier protein